MRKQILNTVTILCLISALTPPLAQAADESMAPPQGGGRPPKEAFEACSGKSEGTLVEVVTPHGTLRATCTTVGGLLFAVPEGGLPKPPSEAIAACQGKTEKMAVELKTPQGTLKAICLSINGTMAAIPEDHLPK